VFAFRHGFAEHNRNLSEDHPHDGSTHDGLLHPAEQLGATVTPTTMAFRATVMDVTSESGVSVMARLAPIVPSGRSSLMKAVVPTQP